MILIRAALAALTALGLVFGSNAAMAGDFELGINGPKDEIKVEARLNEESFQGVASILVPKDKDPQFGLGFTFKDDCDWSISGEGTYDPRPTTSGLASSRSFPGRARTKATQKARPCAGPFPVSHVIAFYFIEPPSRRILILGRTSETPR